MIKIHNAKAINKKNFTTNNLKFSLLEETQNRTATNMFKWQENVDKAVAY